MKGSRIELYRQAQEIAYVAMGVDRDRYGTWHRADQDPLAAWCLAELIVAVADRWRYGPVNRSGFGKPTGPSTLESGFDSRTVRLPG